MSCGFECFTSPKLCRCHSRKRLKHINIFFFQSKKIVPWYSIESKVTFTSSVRYLNPKWVTTDQKYTIHNSSKIERTIPNRKNNTQAVWSETPSTWVSIQKSPLISKQCKMLGKYVHRENNKSPDILSKQVCNSQKPVTAARQYQNFAQEIMW